MVTTENDRKLPPSGVTGYDTSYSLAYLGHESRVLHLADWWVILFRDLLELVVSVKLNIPTQVLELLSEAGFNQVNRTVVDSEFSLTTVERGSVTEFKSCRRKCTWPPLYHTEGCN